jgi:6-phosphogluconate dehydrogenase
MQLIAEAYDILKNIAGFDNATISNTFKQWNTGVLESYLIEITHIIMSKKDDLTGNAISKGDVVDKVRTSLQRDQKLFISNFFIATNCEDSG